MDVKCRCLRMLDTSSLCYESWVVRFALWWVFRYFASMNPWKNKRNYYDDQFFYYNKSIFLRDFIFKTQIHLWYSCKLKLNRNSYFYCYLKKSFFILTLRKLYFLFYFCFNARKVLNLLQTLSGVYSFIFTKYFIVETFLLNLENFCCQKSINFF